MKKDQICFEVEGTRTLFANMALAVVLRNLVDLNLRNSGEKVSNKSVYIDSVAIHSWSSEVLRVSGHFVQDGRSSWTSMIGDIGQGIREYNLWGRFTMEYDMSQEIGFLFTSNYLTNEEIHKRVFKKSLTL